MSNQTSTSTGPGQPSNPHKVVRKRLDEDCLLDGELHPSIAERLARVRELPVGSVANLHGVERDEHGVWLVWQFIDGVTLDEFASQSHSQPERDNVIHELRLAVAAMHAHGIVHGAIHGRNVIIDSRGRVCLTHVSPLLYSDPADDIREVERLATGMGGTARTASHAAGGGDAVVRRYRRRAYLAAAAALLAGVAMFVAILWYIRA